MHSQPYHTVVLSKIYYNYKAIGSHRFIELYLSCQNCGYSKYVRMDKTSNASKNIDYFSSPFNEKGWWWWEYKPTRTYTYDEYSFPILFLRNILYNKIILFHFLNYKY